MRFASLLLLALPAPAFCQTGAILENTVVVTGSGKVSTPPNVAVIQYSLAGEGRTADDAGRELVRIRKTIIDQVGGALGGSAVATDSDLVVLPVRGARCENASGYNTQPRLSEAECAVIGYLATSQGTIRTSQISKAGTAVGLASRLGARDARLQGFELEDNRAAQRAAMADAVADASRQASTIAAAAGRRLGAIVNIRDQNSGYGEVIVQARTLMSAPPPPPPPPPVEISLSPRPIETAARVDVTFVLLP